MVIFMPSFEHVDANMAEMSRPHKPTKPGEMSSHSNSVSKLHYFEVFVTYEISIHPSIHPSIYTHIYIYK